MARELRISIPSVSKWRQRFSLWGLRGLLDQPRSGKPVKYDAAFRNQVLALLEETPPPGMSHWDGPAVAENSARVFTPFGVSCARKGSTCSVGAVGA